MNIPTLNTTQLQIVLLPVHTPSVQTCNTEIKEAKEEDTIDLTKANPFGEDVDDRTYKENDFDDEADPFF